MTFVPMTTCTCMSLFLPWHSDVEWKLEESKHKEEEAEKDQKLLSMPLLMLMFSGYFRAGLYS